MDSASIRNIHTRQTITTHGNTTTEKEVMIERILLGASILGASLLPQEVLPMLHTQTQVVYNNKYTSLQDCKTALHVIETNHNILKLECKTDADNSPDVHGTEHLSRGAWRTGRGPTGCSRGCHKPHEKHEMAQPDL